MDQQREDRLTFRQSFNIAYLLALIHFSCLIPFLRTNVGIRFFNPWNVIGGLIALGFVGAIGEEPLVYLYALVWLVMMPMCTKGSRKVHSKYWGDPLVAPICKTEEGCIYIGEPLICIIVGVLVGQWCPLFGWFIGMGSISGPMFANFVLKAQEEAMIAMEDARIEMESRTRAFRERMEEY